MAEKTVTVVWPDTGETKEVSEANLKSELSVGYELDTPEARAARAEAEKYSTTGQQIATGAEGVARGASMGLSDMAETGLGIAEPEDIEARRQQNPGIAGTGEAAGLIGSLFIPGVGEAEGVMKGASLATALPRATEALGKGASGLTKKLLQGLGAAPEGIATKALSSAADLAAQSEIYNAAQQVDETHLAGGNMEQAAENIAASSGDVLTVGAALGAATHVGGHLLLTGAQKSVNGLGKFIRERFIPSVGQKAADVVADKAVASGAMTEEAAQKYTADVGVPDSEGAIARAQLSEPQPEPLTNAQKAEAFEKLGKELGTHLRPVIDMGNDLAKKLKAETRPSMERMLADAPQQMDITPEKYIDGLIASARDVVNQEKETADRLLSDPSQYPQPLAHRVRLIAATAEDRLNHLLGHAMPYEATEAFRAIDEQGLEGGLRDKAHSLAEKEWNKISAKLPPVPSAVKGFRLIKDAGAIDDYESSMQDAAYAKWRAGVGPKPAPFEGGIFDHINQKLDLKGDQRVSGAAEAFEKLTKGNRTWDGIKDAIEELKQVPGMENLRLPDEIASRMMDRGADTSFDFGANDAAKAKHMPEAGELTPMQIHDFINKERDTVYDWAYKKKYTGPEEDAGRELKGLGRKITDSMHDPAVRGPQAALQQRIDDALAERKLILGPKGALRTTLLEERAKRGGTEWVLRSKKLNTYAGQMGTFRGEDTAKGLTRLVDNTQDLVNLYKQAGVDEAQHDYDKAAIRRLTDTQRASGFSRADKLREIQQHIDATGTTIVKGTAQGAEMNRMKALANAPFTTAIDPATGRAESTGIRSETAAPSAPVFTAIPGLRTAQQAMHAASHDPLAALKTISRLETFAEKTSRRIQAGVSRGLARLGELGERAESKVLRPYAAHEIGEKRDVKQSNRDQRKEYQREEKEQTQTAAAAPNYQQHLAVHAPSVAAHAPKITAAVAAQQKKIAAVVNAAMPRDPSPMPPLGRGNDWVPSRSEWQDFQQTKKIATNPMTAVERFRDGQLTPQDVKTMTQLWPNVLGQMRREAAQAIEKTREPLTSRQIEQLSTLFATPVDAAQTPDFQAAVQGVWQKQAQAKAQQQASAASSADKFAQSFMTKNERLAAK